MVERPYSIVNDPIYYGTVGFFALLTTSLPAVLGQPNFLPIVQTLALFIFLLIPLRQGMLRQALLVVVLWLGIQFTLMGTLTWLLESNVERAIHGGFQYRMAYTAWFFGAASVLRPDSLMAQPLARMLELLGVILGSLVSGGLIGVWFLVKSVNLAGYSMGTLLVAFNNLPGIILALPLWTLCRIAGYAGLVLLLSQPALNGNWQLAAYWRTQRWLITPTFALLLIGLLLELFLPDLWRLMAGMFIG
ncbi:MAG: hypothetical protein KF832_29840 [Caldilineaceae bacterium]|nr:hypothetical protein [Caldilineaceae bacterium]